MPKLAIFALILALLWAVPCAQADVGDGLPLIVEQYSAVVVLTRTDLDYQEVLFYRGTKRFASRMVTESMEWHAQGPNYVLTFRDWWTAERVILTPVVIHIVVTPVEDSESGWEWHDMRRDMRDLKQP